MTKRKPLFIYDCDGTLQTLLTYAWALTKKEEKTNISREEFKAQNFGEDVAMLPGMEDLVHYTETIGNNVLLSEGNPQEGCTKLRALKKYFQNWKFKGQDVPWGRVPENLSKVARDVAKELFDNFKPDQIIVIGDSMDEYVLALHMAYFGRMFAKKHHQEPPKIVALLKRGKRDEAVLNSDVPLIAAESGAQMQQIIQKVINNSASKSLTDILDNSQKQSPNTVIKNKNTQGK